MHSTKYSKIQIIYTIHEERRELIVNMNCTWDLYFAVLYWKHTLVDTLNSFLSACIKTIRGLHLPQPSYCSQHTATAPRYNVAQQIAHFNNVSLLRAVLWTEISRTAIQRETLSVVRNWKNIGLAHTHTQLSTFNWGLLKRISLGTANHSRGRLLLCPHTVRNTSGSPVLRTVDINRGTFLRLYGAERRIELVSLIVI